MLKAKETALSRNWVVTKRQGASYTGGNVSVTSDGRSLACSCADRVAILDLASGAVTRIIPEDVAGVQTEAIVSFVASPTQQKLVTFGRNLSIKLWDINTGLNTKTWKGHRLPVLCCDIEPSGTLVASGGADKLLFCWDADHGHATHSFKGHEAGITAVKFVPSPFSVERLASGDETGRVCLWDLMTSSCLTTLSEHYSTVTAILFSPDPNGYTMVTAGRDKTLAVWDVRELAAPVPAGSAAPKREPKLTLTVLEGIEGAVTLPVEASPEHYNKNVDASGSGAAKGREMVFATAGDAGKLRKWRLAATSSSAGGGYTCTCVQATTIHHLRQGLPAASGAAASALSTGAGAEAAASGEVPVSRQFGGLLLRRKQGGTPASSTAPADAVGGKRKRADDQAASFTSSGSFELVAVARDHVLTCVDSAEMKATRTIVGYNDECLDAKYLQDPGLVYPSAGSSGDGGDDRESSSSAPLYCASPRDFIPRLAVATNSEQLRLVDTRTFDTRLCDGHSGIILSVAASPDGSLVATASKDTTCRIWDVLTGHCLAVLEGHAEAVTAVSWPVKPSNFTHLTPSIGGQAPAVLGSAGWLLSGSKDRTLKLWQLNSLLSTLQSPRPKNWLSRSDKVFASPPAKPRTAAAIVAHEKDVNTVAVAPHDRMAATGSQDKTIKLWSLPDLSLIATLRGHRRGVWSVAFSPTDQVLASASGDRSVRLWAATPAAGFACLRSFEGHDASALNVRFLRKGTQLVSCGADGLLKLWEIRGGECLNTFDAHTQKIWALAVRPPELKDLEAEPSGSASAAASFAAGAGKDDKKSSKKKSSSSSSKGGKDNAMEEDDAEDAAAPAGSAGEDNDAGNEHELVTGGGDSVLNVWRDVTSVEAENAVQATEEALLKQQSLMTAMALRDYQQAVSLTLELDQPRRCGDILGELLETGPLPVTATLTPAQKDALYRDQMLAELQELKEIENAAGEAETFNAAAGALSSSSSSSLSSSRHGPGGSIEGEHKLVAVLKSLNFLHLGRLLVYIREWNTQSRNGILAQNLLFLILRHLPRRTLLLACKAILSLQHYNTVGGGALKVISGVGSVLTQGQAGALSLLPSLAPVVDPGDAFGEATATMLANSGGANAKSSAKEAVTTAAAADLLRSIIIAIQPYSERHLDRLDRLLVNSHRVDYTLGAMQVLQPMSEEELAAIGVASDGTTMLRGSKKGGKGGDGAAEGRGRSEYATDSDDDDDDDDSSSDSD